MQQFLCTNADKKEEVLELFLLYVQLRVLTDEKRGRAAMQDMFELSSVCNKGGEREK